MNEEVDKFFEWIETHFKDTLPLTIMGYLLLIFPVAILKPNSIEFMASIGKTGLSVISLGCCYVIGKASHLLINAILSGSILCYLGVHKFNKEQIKGFKERQPRKNEKTHCLRCDQDFELHWNELHSRVGIHQRPIIHEITTKMEDHDVQ